ncbi:DnaA regulatory inactivator Hda [Aliikangiella sp. IMCC44359]|uniref:DnaA regulatory inactivator Hda n=1 Tax=Aliikangiella sp. IMCC44359 TaxID=3459125 RepID=UPI00403B1900
MLQLPLNIQLDDSAKFDNYFEKNNLQLVSRLKQLVNNQGDFIFVWGNAETGKTHLANAICHSFNQHELSAAYFPLDNKALTPDVLQGMAVMDFVCIDNFESIVGQNQWEVGLFDLYNNLKSEKKTLVVFADASPSALSINLADLKSRLGAMEIYKLEGLNDEQKADFFKNRAANRGLDISSDVARFILTRYSRSVKELINILDKLDRSSIVLKRKITIPLVKEILD